MEKEIGITKEENEEYFGRFITHLDCYCWVDRDSYLPQGSRGLKAVTKAKLGYEPIEVDRIYHYQIYYFYDNYLNKTK